MIDLLVAYTHYFLAGFFVLVMEASSWHLVLVQYLYTVASIFLGFHLVSANTHYPRPTCALLSINWYAACFFAVSHFSIPTAINLCLAIVALSWFMARKGQWPLLFPRTTVTVTVEKRPDYTPDWWWTVYGDVVGDPVEIAPAAAAAAAPPRPPPTVITNAEQITFGNKVGCGVSATLKVDAEDVTFQVGPARPVVMVVDRSGSMGDNASKLGTAMYDIEGDLGDKVNLGQISIIFFDTRITHSTDVGDPKQRLCRHIQAGGGTAYNPAEAWILERFSETGAIVYFMTDGEPNSDHGEVMPTFKRLAAANDPRWTFRALFLTGPYGGRAVKLEQIFTHRNIVRTESVDHVRRWLVSALGRVAPRIDAEMTVQVLERGRPLTPEVKVTPTHVAGGTVRVVVGGIPPKGTGRRTLVIKTKSDTYTTDLQARGDPRPATDEEKTIVAGKVIAGVQETLATGDVKKIRGGLAMINELIRTLPTNTAVEALRDTIKELLADLEAGKAAASLRGGAPKLAQLMEEAGDLLNFATENLGGRLKRTIGKALEKMANALEGTDQAAVKLADVVRQIRQTRPANPTVNGPECPVTGTPILGRGALVIKTTMSNLDKLKSELEEGNPKSRFWLNVASGGKNMGVRGLGVYDLEAAYAYARQVMRDTREGVIVIPLGAVEVAPMIAGQVLYGSPTLPKNLKASQAVVFSSIAAQELADVQFTRGGGSKVLCAKHVAGILSLCPYYRAVMGESKRSIPPKLALVDGEKTTAGRLVLRYLEMFLDGNGTLGGLVQRSTTNTADPDAQPDNDDLMPDVLHAVVQLLWATLDTKGVDAFGADVQLSLFYEVVRAALKRFRQETTRVEGNVTKVVDRPYLDLLRQCFRVSVRDPTGPPSPLRSFDPAGFWARVDQVVRDTMTFEVDPAAVRAVVEWIENEAPFRGSGGGALPMVKPSSLRWLVRVAQGIQASGNTHASVAANNGLPPDEVALTAEAPPYLFSAGATSSEALVAALHHGYQGTGIDARCKPGGGDIGDIATELLWGHPLVVAQRAEAAAALRRKALDKFFRKFDDPACSNPIKLAMEFFKFFTQIDGVKEAAVILARLTTSKMVQALAGHPRHLATIFQTVTQLEFAPNLAPLVGVVSIPVLPCIAPILMKNEEFRKVLERNNPKYRIYVREPPRMSAPRAFKPRGEGILGSSKRLNAYYISLLAKTAGIKQNGDKSLAHTLRAEMPELQREGSGVVLTTIKPADGVVGVVHLADPAGTPFARVGDNTYLAGKVISVTFKEVMTDLRHKPECKYDMMINPCVVTVVTFETGRRLTRQPNGSFTDSHPDEPLMPEIKAKKKKTENMTEEEKVREAKKKAALEAANKLRDAAIAELDKIKKVAFTRPVGDDAFDVSLFF